MINSKKGIAILSRAGEKAAPYRFFEPLIPEPVYTTFYFDMPDALFYIEFSRNVL